MSHLLRSTTQVFRKIRSVPESWWIGLALLLVTVLQLARWCRWTQRYAVNVLFSDQWDFYEMYFQQVGWIQEFLWQHGPHRQGVGAWLTHLVAESSGWDTRAEAWTGVGLLVLALGLALITTRRLFGQWHWSDVALPLVILSVTPMETVLLTPNLSYGLVPLVLILGSALALTLPTLSWRLGWVSILSVALIFTGFGLFAGIWTTLWLAVEAGRSGWKRDWSRAGWHAGAWVVCAGALGLFFVDYQFQPAVPDFQFPHPDLERYPQFVFLTLGYFWTGKPGMETLWIGVVTAMVLGGFGLWTLRQWWGGKREERHRALVILGGFLFTALWLGNAAIGRVSLGAESGCCSRYMIFLVPAWVSLVWAGRGLRFHPAGRWTLGVWVVLLLLTEGWGREVVKHDVSWITQNKRAWLRAYRETGDIRKSGELSGVKIYPNPEEGTLMETKLEYMRNHGLNLFGPEVLTWRAFPKPRPVCVFFQVVVDQVKRLPDGVEVVGWSRLNHLPGRLQPRDLQLNGKYPAQRVEVTERPDLVQAFGFVELKQAGFRATFRGLDPNENPTEIVLSLQDPFSGSVFSRTIRLNAPDKSGK